MDDSRTQAELDQRWDLHTERQLAMAKGGVAAVTILNSGSWLALLSQADKLLSLAEAGGDASSVFLLWGLGAFLGTLTWLFMYLSTLAQGQHDFYRQKKRYIILLEACRFLGLLCVISGLICFLLGVFALSRLAAVA